MNTENKNPDLNSRLKTAAVLIAIVLGTGIFAVLSVTGALIFTGLGLLSLLLAGYEYFSVRKQNSLVKNITTELLIIAAIFLPIFLNLSFVYFLEIDSQSIHLADRTLMRYYLSTVLFFPMLLVWISSATFKLTLDMVTFVKLLCADLIAQLLLGIGGAALVLLALFWPAKVLFLIFLVAIADSSAYFVGRKFGGPKIAALVSPKKTVIGTVSALFITGLVAGVTSLFFGTKTEFINFFISGFMIAFCSQAGDFAKSIIKRSFATKDFSNLLPGHGGIFDRIDGLLGAAPIFLIFVLCSQ